LARYWSDQGRYMRDDQAIRRIAPVLSTSPATQICNRRLEERMTIQLLARTLPYSGLADLTRPCCYGLEPDTAFSAQPSGAEAQCDATLPVPVIASATEITIHDLPLDSAAQGLPCPCRTLPGEELGKSRVHHHLARTSSSCCQIAVSSCRARRDGGCARVKYSLSWMPLYRTLRGYVV
jgi:hypothetical protein